MATRRQILQGAAAGVVGAGARPLRAAAAGRERVAVVGAGMGGIAAAYFLSGTFAVDVFEARSRIGGHADSRTVDVGGEPVVVDLGAQFFHPATLPTYVALLDELGLTGQTRASQGSLTVFPVGRGEPAFTSTRPLETLPNALGFAAFTQAARRAVLDELPWRVTVDEWIASLPLEPAFKADVLHPWITATIGCPRAATAHVSARSILQTFALAFPEDVAAGAQTYNSRIGLQGNLRRMLDRAPGVRVHRRAPVRALSRDRDGWTLRTPTGRHGPYRFVVLNAPPRVGRELLRPLPAFRRATAILDRCRYFDSRILVHRDPAYAPADLGDWTAYNAGVDGQECEGSAWIGALHDPLASGASVELFKSWAQRRRADPRQVVLERRFKHPLIDARAIGAARALQPLQGRHGLFFSGAYTTGADLQETALWSAMQVAQELAPRSRRLRALQARLPADVSYAL